MASPANTFSDKSKTNNNIYTHTYNAQVRRVAGSHARTQSLSHFLFLFLSLSSSSMGWGVDYSDYLSELVSVEIEKDLDRRQMAALTQPAVFLG